MKLSELKTGEKAVIVKVYGHGSFRKRISEMGFVKGSKVKVILNAPLKDPIEYEIIGYKISLRREEAEMIDVVSESEAANCLTQQEDLPGIEVNDSNEAKMTAIAAKNRKKIRVALVGNPNCGKTSLFNIASGSHEHVGNYSGVTVDAKEGNFEFGGYEFILVDLPGTYSLSAYSPEELYVRSNLIEEMPDVVVNVVDASNLQRNLYLTAQLIDMNLRVVMALNMYDELQAKGDKLDIEQLGHLLGIPVRPTVSRTGKGIDRLFNTIIQIYENSDPNLARHIHINHGKELEKSISKIQTLIKQNTEIRFKYSTRYLAIKYLENDKHVENIVEALPNRDEIITMRFEEQKRIDSLLGTTTESAIIDAKYAFIQGALAETYVPHKGSPKLRSTITDKIDAIVTNQYLAFPIFFILLYLVFTGTFSLGGYPMQWIEWLIEKIGLMVSGVMHEGWIRDMIVDGVIGGVGSVLVFLPNILILYLFISLLEDSGYMARAAFIMDKVMHKMGLHGKSFIPMIMGFGCNVPAIMATRMIESRKSRLITILVIPFMSCSGRMPVYILIAGAFFGGNAPLVLLGLYAFGILTAILSAKFLSHFIKDDDLPFVMELPPYRVPTGKSVFRHTWEKGKQYLHKMGGTILICSIIIWFLGYFPRNPQYKTEEERQEHSYIGYVGKAIEPVLRPLGFDWRMGVGIVAGVGAKELVVSSMGVLYGTEGEFDTPKEPMVTDGSGTPMVTDGTGTPMVTDGSSETYEPINNQQLTAESLETEEGVTILQRALQKSVSPAAGMAFLVFVLLYFPCIATFIAIKNETGKWKYAIYSAIYTIVLAWVVAFIVYRIGLLFM